ncbi:MAG TPA: hypothetical protein VEK79_16255 [Thermoanaerobaculia bacterium]|nr:hypothetical protein [Thermoanaerobaculia bacterium]
MSEIERLLSELKTVQTSDAVAFPYADCRKLQAVDGRYAALIPDLDAYLSEIAGYGNWGRRLLTWPDDKIVHVLHRITASFFDRYPMYADLRSQITPENVPSLHAAIERGDQVRKIVAELLRHLRMERTATV